MKKLIIGAIVLVAAVLVWKAVGTGDSQSELQPGWETFDGDGFTLNLPSSFEETSVQDPYAGMGNVLAAWMSDEQSYTASNYSQDSWLAVSSAETTEAACTGAASSQSFTGETTIDGVTFKMNESTEAGAGNRYEKTLYRTYHDGKCYDVVTTLHYASDFTDIDEAAMEDSQDAARADLKAMVQSFKFE